MAAPSENTGGTGAKTAKGFSLVGFIVELVAISIIAGGAGVAMAFLRGAPPPSATLPQQDKPGAAPERNLVDLPPIVTNIASPNDLWVRVEAAIVIDGKSATPPDILAAEIATDALAYLRTLTIGQIEGPIGLENIRQDLADRATVRSKGKVSELILKTLVLQ